jgi:hypothetical protein
VFRQQIVVWAVSWNGLVTQQQFKLLLGKTVILGRTPCSSPPTVLRLSHLAIKTYTKHVYQWFAKHENFKWSLDIVYDSPLIYSTGLVKFSNYLKKQLYKKKRYWNGDSSLPGFVKCRVARLISHQPHVLCGDIVSSKDYTNPAKWPTVHTIRVN